MEDDEFSPAGKPHDATPNAARANGGEAGRKLLLPAGIEPGDAPPFEQRPKAANNSFDFGKFRHAGILRAGAAAGQRVRRAGGDEGLKSRRVARVADHGGAMPKL